MKVSIGTKLAVGFGFALMTFVASGMLNYTKLATIRVKADRITNLRIPVMEAARIAQDRVDYCSNKTRQGILAGTDPARRADAQRAFDEAWAAVDKQIALLMEYSPRFTLQVNRDRVIKLKQELPKLKEAQQARMAEAASGAKDAIVKAGFDYTAKVTPLVNANTKALSELAESFDDFFQKDSQELAIANATAVWTIIISTILALVIGIAVSVALSRRISSTTGAILKEAQAIAAGDLTREKLEVASEDELGELTRAINAMQSSLCELIESISENAQSVASASEEFSAVSQQISANSEETSAQANVVTEATEHVSRGLQTVATSTEEMSATIKEIAKSAAEAAKVADGAMKSAAETNAIVAKLGESSGEIGQVIKVITSIAQKTDLLALNATVEAARAGEVGAGFAVVANEVKELAKQTANATEDISRKIEAIQADASAAVTAIESITEVIGQVNNISGTIATAVEEQSATTSEMSRNVAEAAKGSGEVTQNIQGVAQAAESTSHGATDSMKAAKNLAEMSTRLRELVSRFKLSSERRGHNPMHRRGSAVKFGGYSSVAKEENEAELAMR